MKGILYACVRDKKGGNLFQVRRQYFQRQDYMAPLNEMKIEREVTMERCLDYNLFGSVRDDCTYFCVATADYPIRRCYEFMVELRQIESDEALKELFKSFNDPKTDLIGECETLVDVRREETLKNLDISLARGEGMERVIEKADRIQTVTFETNKKSKKLKKSHDWISIALYLMIGLVVAGAITSVIIILVVKYAVLK